MPFETHPAISEPDDDTVIWRYYSISQLLWVLQNESLYLSRLENFEDPFEGYSPAGDLEQDFERAKRSVEELEEKANEDVPIDPKSSAIGIYRTIRNLSYVNCWSKETGQSLAMWKSYIDNGDGVAIKTTVGDLKDAIDAKSNYSYHIGVVEYYDYFDDFLSTNNFFDFVMSKPLQYEYEKEIRLFIWAPNTDIDDPGPDSPEPGDLVDIEPTPNGIDLNVDVDELISEVVVSPFGPPWLTPSYCENILDRFEVTAPARASELSMEPTDYLEEN